MLTKISGEEDELRRKTAYRDQHSSSTQSHQDNRYAGRRKPAADTYSSSAYGRRRWWL